MKYCVSIRPVKNGWVVQRIDRGNTSYEGDWVFNTMEQMVTELPEILETTKSPSAEPNRQCVMPDAFA